MINSAKLYALVMKVIRSPIVKVGRVAVAVSGGNYTFNLDIATIFDVSVTANGGAVFTCSDPTKCYQIQINATTTGAYDFTSYTMSGVTIYEPAAASIVLQSTGRTCLGCLYDGPAATLDMFNVDMTPV